MSTMPVRLPLAVRAFNAAANPFRRRLLPLEPEKLMAEARRKAGRSDFGDDGFRIGLAKLCDSLDREAGLTPLGRTIARRELLRWLGNRIEMQRWRERHPEIDREVIERPLFVVGMGRTGTTILHDLLAEDPQNRVPYSWELAAPCPPPERAHADDDPRIAALDAELAGLTCGGNARCLLVPAADLPADLWERLRNRDPVGLVARLDGDRVTDVTLVDAETASGEAISSSKAPRAPAGIMRRRGRAGGATLRQSRQGSRRRPDAARRPTSKRRIRRSRCRAASAPRPPRRAAVPREPPRAATASARGAARRTPQATTTSGGGNE